MKRSFVLMTLLSCLIASGAVPQTKPPAGQKSTGVLKKGERPVLTAVRLPVVFEENNGQAPTEVRFVVRKLDHSVFFLDNEILFSPGRPDTLQAIGPIRRLVTESTFVAMQFVDGRSQVPRIKHKMKAHGNYLAMKDGPKLLTLADCIVYRGLYPGIDLRFYNAEGRMRYEFALTPQANVKAIKVRFRHARNIKTDKDGNLVVNTSTGTLRHSAPIVYASANRSRRRIQGRFIVLSPTDVGIRVTGARPGESIRIDPVLTYSTLAYSTYLGGTESTYYIMGGSDPFVSAHGYNVDVYFHTASSGFPGAAGFTQSELAGVLLRFDCSVPQSPTVVFMIVFPYSWGGRMGLTSASDGSVYVLGSAPANCPLGIPADALQPTPDNRSVTQAPFIARVEPNGTIQRITYLWGFGGPLALAVVADGADPGVYVTGTVSQLEPLPQYMQNPVQPPPSNYVSELVLLKVDLNLRQVRYVTFIGDGYSSGVAIAVRADKASVLAVSDPSATYPVTSGAYQSTEWQNMYARNFFLTTLDPSGAIAVSAFLGRSPWYSFAVDTYPGGEVVAGSYDRSSPNEPNLCRAADKLSSDGSSLLFQTAPFPSIVLDLAADNAGGVWVGGVTSDPGQATAAAVQPSLAGGYQDGFVALYSANGTLDYYTYLGGNGWDQVTSIARESDFTYVAGLTSSSDFPITSTSALQPTLAGTVDAFFLILRSVPMDISVQKVGLPSQINQNGHVTYNVRITNAGNASLSGLTIVDVADQELVLFPPVWQTTGAFPSWSDGPPNTFSCTNLTLGAGRSVSFNIEAVGLSEGMFQNCATVLTGNTVLASSCDVTVVNPVTALNISVDDDVTGSAPQGTEVHFTVTVTNLGNTAVSGVQVHHLPLSAPFTPPFTFTNVYSPDGGAFSDPNWGDADGYTWVFNSIGSNEAARLFVTAGPAKRGRRQTQAIATISGSSDGPWEAVSTTDIGAVVTANLDVIVHRPITATPPSNVQTISVDLRQIPPLVDIPSFQLRVEVIVDQTTFPSKDVTPPDATPPEQVGWFNKGGSGGVETWEAVFNVKPNFQTGTAVIRLPNTVNIRTVRAHAGDPSIIDSDGAESTWP